jgi:SH3-like domain-containing protein
MDISLRLLASLVLKKDFKGLRVWIFSSILSSRCFLVRLPWLTSEIVWFIFSILSW